MFPLSPIYKFDIGSRDSLSNVVWMYSLALSTLPNANFAINGFLSCITCHPYRYVSNGIFHRCMTYWYGGIVQGVIEHGSNCPEGVIVRGYLSRSNCPGVNTLLPT